MLNHHLLLGSHGNVNGPGEGTPGMWVLAWCLWPWTFRVRGFQGDGRGWREWAGEEGTMGKVMVGDLTSFIPVQNLSLVG